MTLGPGGFTPCSARALLGHRSTRLRHLHQCNCDTKKEVMLTRECTSDLCPPPSIAASRGLLVLACKQQ